MKPLASNLFRSALLIVAAFLMLGPEAGFGQNLKTWIGQGTGGSGTVFNTGANWSPSGTPSSTDSCVMLLTSGATVTVSSDISVYALHCEISSATPQVFRLDATDKSLTVLNDLYGSASGDAATHMEFSVGAATTGGKIQVNGPASLGTAGSSPTITRGTGTNSQFVFRGDVTYGSSSLTSGSSFPSTYVFDAAGTQTFTVNSSSVALSSVKVGDINTASVILAGSSNASLSSSAPTANLTVSANCQLDLSDNTLNRSSSGGTFTLSAGATLKLGASVGGQSGSNFPINYTTVTLDPTSTVEYNAPGGVNQTVFATPTYGYLTISNSSGLSTTTKTAGGALIVTKDLVTDTGSVFDCSTFSHTIKGSAITNGSHQGTGKIVLQLGASQHSISGTGTFRNVELNDAAGAGLASNVTITGALTLTNGTLSAGSDSLTLGGQVTATSGNLTSLLGGTIIYGQASNGQNVLAANYGNLTFSRFRKVLAFNGTIGVAGVFFPDTAVGHTITGSTIDFNGAGAQAIPAFKYNSLTSSSTGSRTLASSGTIGIAGAFTPGTNAYTITGSTIEYNGSSPQNLPAGFLTYNNLVINNSLQVTGISGLVVTSLLEVKSGTFNSSSTFNNVQIDTLARLSTPVGDTLKINGNWKNSGTFSSNSSTVRFNGSIPDTIYGSSTNTFDNLIINNSSGTELTMNANCTVNATLTLLTVNVNTGTKTLTIGSSGSVLRTSGYIIGNMKKTYGATGTKLFEVGTPNGYSPVSVNDTIGTGTFTVKAVEGPRPGAIGSNVLQRYWTLSSAGITQANLTFFYLAGDVAGTEANYVLSTYNGTWTTVGGSVNTVLHQASIANATTFADWTLGEPSSFLGLSIGNIDVSEGNNGTVNADFTVNLSGTSSQAVTVNYATQDSTALISDNDYVANTNMLTIPAGETSGTISVLLNGDLKFEPNELFKLALSGATNAALLNSLALCTIQNDDSLPTVTLGDVAGVEGPANDSTLFNFHVSLSNPSYQSISFNFQTLNKSAKADTDYRANSGIITINPNDTSATIPVTVLGDLVAEPNDTFRVKLTNPSNATIGDSLADGIILNDDGATLTIGDVVAYEGNSGIKSFVFPLQLSNPLPQTVTLNYSTDSSEGSATGGVDFNRKNGVATILPGQVTSNITIDVKGDTLDEPDETFNVFIWNSVNATIIHNTGTGTILNNDLSISIIDSTAQKLEGQSGTTPFTFTVKLSKSSAHPVSVRFRTADSNATVADNDYDDSAGVMIFAPGTTSKNLIISVTGDTKDEVHERFFLNLDSVSNGIIADSQGAGIIYNDDAKISINDVSAAEGDSGQTNFVFTVSLTSPSTTQAKVWSRLIDNTATVADSDYIRKQDTVTFSPGEVTKFITVRAKGDTTFESDETFFMKLTRLAGTTLPIADTQGTATILNDDGRICVTKYYDENHNGQLDAGELPMPNTVFKLKSLTRGFTLSSTTDINGQACFSKIKLDTYRLTEVLDTNYSYSVPDSGSIVYTLHSGDDIQTVWLNSASFAAQAFRTGRYEDWAKSVNAKGKQKGVPRVPDKVEAKFYLVAPQTASSLKLHFNVPFTGKIYNDSLRTTLIDSIDKSKDKAITLPIPLAHVYLVEGFGSKGSQIAVTAYWEVAPSVFVPEPLYLQSQFRLRELRLPMPNLHNVGEELFAGATAPFGTGMLVGVPQGTKKGNSVLHGKYGDVLKSFQYKGGLHNLPTLRCLDKFDGKLTPITKQQKSLPPNKHNNRLFAELLTFELSLAASRASLFPNGLGDLMYQDSADISNPLNGKTLKEIAAIGDTVISCQTLTSMVTPTYDQLYNVIRKVDTTFSGPVDTLNFSIATRLKGVRLLREVPFLLALPGAAHPAPALVPVVTENVPLSYKLEQNYPNPFNPTTTIEFQLQEPALVTLKIYNTLGQEVNRLLDRVELDEGQQEIEFDGGNLSSGVYFYRLEVSSIETNATIFYQTRKMVLVK